MCLFLFTVGVPILRALYFFQKWVSIRLEHHAYIEYLDGKRPYEDIAQRRSIVEELIGEAGFGDAQIQFVENAGYGMVRHGSISPLVNYGARDGQTVQATLHLMLNTIGLYSKKAWESFFPWYWAKVVVFLPRMTFEYLGVPAGSVFTKAMQVLWFVVAPLFGLLYAVYEDELFTFIRALLASIIPGAPL